ncbi:MAG: hypothetical protein IJE01_07610 [Clostridia bacterium]|nr:hypothetical protein [Clostridia bacterium]
MKFSLNWQVGYCNSVNSRPEEYFSATVPSAVQLDYAKEYNLPDYREGVNFKDYQWMQEKFWVYTTEFFNSSISEKAKLFLVAKGIDYEYDIYANGEKVFSYEGIYKTAKVDLTHLKNTKIKLEIVIHPAPKCDFDDVFPGTRSEAKQSCKPAVNYGWDFHPRLIALGICDEIYLEATEHTPLNPLVTYTLNNERTRATVFMEAGCKKVKSWTLTDPDGNIVFIGSGESQCFSVDNPRLWWCNGYGKPELYTWQLEIENLGASEFYYGKIGFRTVELTTNDGAVQDLYGIYPKTRTAPPITVTLNGVKIFAKGSNWVAPEVFYGIINRNRSEEMLQLVKNCNMNILRFWGGAVVNKDFFYDVCDELGILVWQEFPLACNNYVATKKYLEVLESEATAIINRLRVHPSLCMWCGGNELFNEWSGMNDQSLALRLLNKLTLELTPEIPFIPTSPLMGMAHGHYRFLYEDGREVIEVMQKVKHTAYTEFGVSSISNLDCLLKIANKEHFFPLEPDDITIAHHAFKAWGDGAHAWVKTIEKYFPNIESIEELIEKSQLIQSVGLQFIYEEARRQKPYCSMALAWCFDEPWPCVANNSIICYPNSVKPGYYAVKSACRDVLASGRIRKFSYKAGEEFDFDLFLLNDSNKQVLDGVVSAYIQIGNGEKVHLIDWQYKNVQVNKNVAGPTVRCILPNVSNAQEMKLILESGAYSSEYTMLYEPEQVKVKQIKKLNE